MISCFHKVSNNKKHDTLKVFLKFKNVKESAFFNIFSEKPENTIVLKMTKIPQIKKC